MNNMTGLLPHLKLRFSIEHPSFEECYAYGYECACADISESENPFLAGTKDSDQWSEGWWAGFYGEQPLYAFADDFEEITANEQLAANDQIYCEPVDSFFVKVMKITGLIAVSAAVGFQVIDLVA
jgi:hypothetical protein